MSSAAQISINLLPKDPFLTTPLGKILKWATSIGRYLVIFTELIVVLCFASRFTLDRQITDLNTSILQKKTIIESYGALEADIRAAQFKIDQLAQIEPQTNLVDIFPKLAAVIPTDIRLDQLTIQPTSVAFSGKTASRETLNGFIRSLQTTPLLTNVTMDKIDVMLKTNTAVPFKISAEVVGQKAAQTQEPGEPSEGEVAPPLQ